MREPIQTAELDWQATPLGETPLSRQFGDVYFSRANGLAETQYVFLQGNDLPQRLAQLGAYDYFVVGETGFGTGLNFLALWQLWRQVRPDNHSRLHMFSVEKHPLTLTDLRRALANWPELADMSAQLLAQYPPPLSGVHRLIFAEERLSLDIWLGDAAECLSKIYSERPIQAWFLDGFAPACNPELWQAQVIDQIVRLSAVGTTFASFSVAQVVRQGLAAHGISVTRPKGFKYRREMLKAHWPQPESDTPTASTNSTEQLLPIAVIGAGIAGLSCAYALAQRGYAVQIFDQSKPLAGASGNPRALLMPKLTPLSHVSEHLHTLGWLSTLRWWSVWQQDMQVLEQTGGLSLHTEKHQIEFNKLANYPTEITQAYSAAESSQTSDTALTTDALWIEHAALLNPAALADSVLAHPLISLHTAQVTQLQRSAAGWQLDTANGVLKTTFQHVIVCTALASQQLCPSLPRLNPIRGQLSWCTAPAGSPAVSLSYGGYCAQFGQDGQPQLLFGASFIRQDDQTDLRIEDHQHNAALLADVLPDLAAALPDSATWQGRASIRAQMRDYLPLVGAVPEQDGVWVLAGLGSKGFAFAPLCAELLAAQMFGEVWPVSAALGHKLRASRAAPEKG
ncbi:MAG: FAD-dependent 5-carboxymethylaminomethyl-2-thiouridine(34) oxidoreductase MnmC [Moraxellaceae bacterium]